MSVASLISFVCRLLHVGNRFTHVLKLKIVSRRLYVFCFFFIYIHFVIKNSSQVIKKINLRISSAVKAWIDVCFLVPSMFIQFDDVCCSLHDTSVLQESDVSGISSLRHDMLFTYVFHPLWTFIGQFDNRIMLKKHILIDNEIYIIFENHIRVFDKYHFRDSNVTKHFARFLFHSCHLDSISFAGCREARNLHWREILLSSCAGLHALRGQYFLARRDAL